KAGGPGQGREVEGVNLTALQANIVLIDSHVKAIPDLITKSAGTAQTIADMQTTAGGWDIGNVSSDVKKAFSGLKAIRIKCLGGNNALTGPGGAVVYCDDPLDPTAAKPAPAAPVNPVVAVPPPPNNVVAPSPSNNAPPRPNGGRRGQPAPAPNAQAGRGRQ